MALILGLSAVMAISSEVQWTRFKGEVKALDFKKNLVTIQNKDGDLFTITVDKDIVVVRDKADIEFADVRIDDKIVLMRIPSDKPKVAPPQEERYGPRVPGEP